MMILLSPFQEKALKRPTPGGAQGQPRPTRDILHFGKWGVR